MKRFKPLLCITVFLMLSLFAAIPAHAADYNGAQQALSNGFKQNATTIDLSRYAIPYQQFNSMYDEAKVSGMFPWYVEYVNYTYRNGYITTVSPVYWDPAVYSRALYEQEVSKILNAAIKEDMSEWQIALALYNQLVSQTAYSDTYPPNGGIQRNAYGAIVNKDAVCVGYAYAYMDLLSRCGIPAVVAVSDAMKHEWNLVKIGGGWYHVDATWGDSKRYGKDCNGYISHDYFLLSDAAISDADHEHHSWVAPYTCPNSYGNGNVFWTDTTSSILYMDDSVSFLRKGDYKTIKIYRRDEYTGTQTLLCEQAATVVNITGQNLYYENYGLSLWKDTLYFSDAKHVYAVSPAGGTPKIVYTYNCDANRKTIYGSYVANDTIYLTVKDSYNNTSKITVPLLRSGHTHSFGCTDVAPTCISNGYTLFTCSCGESFQSGARKTVDHKIGTYQVVTEPTWNYSGLKIANCVWCGARLSQSLPALSTVSSCFGDVRTSDYFCEPVLWAYVRGVTSGTAAGVFSPHTTCTRGQVVTFLWRAAGEPEPRSTYNPFRDVSTKDYYYKAVLWAVEKRLTTGTSSSTFSPNDACTRAHVVTFLHRMAGSPMPLEPDRIPFTDTNPKAYYALPMVWAVEQSITTGTGPTTFSPDAPCTRAQTVTFLQRYLVN